MVQRIKGIKKSVSHLHLQVSEAQKTRKASTKGGKTQKLMNQERGLSAQTFFCFAHYFCLFLILDHGL